jgi:hypothetical protein
MLDRMCYENGDTYEGAFSHDHRHGPGRFTWANGDCYQGRFHKDRRYDERGKMILADGTSFEGIFVNDQML